MTASPPKAPLNFQYSFAFEDEETEVSFDLSIDLPSLTLIQSSALKEVPDWAKLSHHQCPNCSLKESETPFCPIALNIQQLIEAFQDKLSYNQVTVTVVTKERTYTKNLPLQRGISSLIGIYMVTSGCPIMTKLQPMVRYHLPFASMEETMYRIISMYLFSQYLVLRTGGEPDWEMHKLIEIYEEIRIVNEHFCKRLSSLAIQDANLNAVVILNNFADFLPFTINDSLLFSIAQYFQPYLNYDP